MWRVPSFKMSARDEHVCRRQVVVFLSILFLPYCDALFKRAPALRLVTANYKQVDDVSDTSSTGYNLLLLM